MKKTLGCMMILALLAACNTVEGAGKDTAEGGKAISKAAAKTKKKL